MEWLFKGLWEFVFWTFTDTTITQPAHTIIWPEGAVTPQLSLQRKKVHQGLKEPNSKNTTILIPKSNFVFKPGCRKHNCHILKYHCVILVHRSVILVHRQREQHTEAMAFPSTKGSPKQKKKIISSKNIK